MLVVYNQAVSLTFKMRKEETERRYKTDTAVKLLRAAFKLRTVHYLNRSLGQYP